MAPNLDSGNYRILSLAGGGPPTSVNFDMILYQPVRLGGPIQKWTVTKDGDTFQFGIGVAYKFVQAVDGKVVASAMPLSEEQRWRATYSVLQNAYIIELADDSGMGWTVTSEISDDDLPVDPDATIEMNPILAMPSVPPQFMRHQLFFFEPIPDDE